MIKLTVPYLTKLSIVRKTNPNRRLRISFRLQVETRFQRMFNFHLTSRYSTKQHLHCKALALLLNPSSRRSNAFVYIFFLLFTPVQTSILRKVSLWIPILGDLVEIMKKTWEEPAMRDQREKNAPSEIQPCWSRVPIFYLDLMTTRKYSIFNLTFEFRIKLTKPIIKL